ncbi:ribose 5-phosphate isomerase B [Desulfohalovibrio reitneri]|uniref:ribose 5-phosphate isomerase B n=1 Tax=Desulfohalovibrio reitneri TaxID=1307759 RepID=UPI0004A7278A|nr:ribose 5-phosphate isomerase B [Desulfohalovibrio reitneri]
MRVIIASDHGGFELKRLVRDHLRGKGFQVDDLGPEEAVSCDYPPFARDVCEKVLEDGEALGVLVCGTGLGMSMSANRVHGIRAALCHNEFSARMARAHNNANVLCLGERVLGPGIALDILEAFLGTEFEGGRHAKRIDLIDALAETGETA